MNYEAGLSVNSQVVAKESVNGESERVRIIGRKGADDNLSSLFTEIINRLDIHKLFQQAKLILIIRLNSVNQAGHTSAILTDVKL